MKKLLFLFLFSVALSSTYVSAQATKYTVHTIVHGETLTLLAQKYHTTVSNIMRANGMNAKSRLSVGQKIKIPLTSTAAGKTAVAKTPAAKAPVKTPVGPPTDTTVVTHYVLQGETLFSISKKFGVTVEQLKQWNKLTDNNIHFGQLLAVSNAGTKMVTAKNEQQQKTEQQNTGETNPVTTDSTIKNEEEKIVNADTMQQQPAKEASVVVVAKNANNTTPVNPASVGYFEKDFPAAESNLKNVNGNAMIFKTASGWKDKKYYILASGIPSGKVVKISSANGKSVYAKVLWSLDNTKTNKGLSFRISDAAASVLGVNEAKFNLTVEYNE